MNLPEIIETGKGIASKYSGSPSEAEALRHAVLEAAQYAERAGVGPHDAAALREQVERSVRALGLPARSAIGGDGQAGHAPNPSLTPKKELLHAAEIAESIKEQHHFARGRDGVLYIYERGVYRGTFGGSTGGYAERKVRSLVVGVLRGAGQLKRWSARLASDVVQYLLDTSLPIDDRRPAGLINCANGLLYVDESGKAVLADHTPDLRTPYQIPVRFDPAATCPSLRRFWKHTGPADAETFPAELAALTLMDRNPCDQSVILVGAGGNGKSTFLDAISALLGDDNVSSVTLQEITRDRFAAADLYAKLANIAGDVTSDDLGSGGPFKALTGGDKVRAQRKHQPSFDFHNQSVLIFSVNETPTTQDNTDGFYRRWVIVPFTRRFRGKARKDRKGLVAELTTEKELSGLLNWALSVWSEVRTGGLTQSATLAEAHRRFQRESNPLAAFLSETILADSEGRVSRDELKALWRDHAKDNDYTVGSAKAFHKAMMQAFPTAKITRPSIHGERFYAYEGVRYYDETRDEGEEMMDAVQDGSENDGPKMDAGEATKANLQPSSNMSSIPQLSHHARNNDNSQPKAEREIVSSKKADMLDAMHQDPFGDPATFDRGDE